MPKLEVLIVTHQPEGIDRVAAMNLPEVEGVGYIVSWQNHGDAPVPYRLMMRNDVKIVRCERRGVSVNRNNALDHGTADYLLIGDDDLIYTPESLKAVIDTMEKNPSVDYASFRYTGPDSKCYPAVEHDLGGKLPKNFYQTTFEICLRRNSPAGKLRFREDFGPGAPVFTAAEDEMMLLTARARGISMRFFPVTVACHPGVTTGNREISDDGVLLASGAVIAKLYPATAFLRLPLKAFRLSRAGQASFFRSLKSLTRGALMSLRIRL